MHPVFVDIPLGWLELPLSLSVAAAALLAALFAVFVSNKSRVGWTSAVAIVGFSAAFAYQVRGVVWNVDGVVLSSFGTCLFAGGAVGAWLVVRGADRRGIAPDVAWRALLAAAVAGLLGARLGYAWINAPTFGSVWDIMAVGSGGLSVVGGLVLGLGATLWVLARARLSPLVWGDTIMAPLLCLAVWVCAGSYLAGAEQGRLMAKNAPDWLARLGTFPKWAPHTLPGVDGPPVLLDQVASGVVPLGAAATLPVHPTQLYELVALVFLLAIVVSGSRSRRRRGETLMIGALGYSLCRLVIEMLRGDTDRGLLPIALSNLARVALFAAPVALALCYVATRRRSEPARAVAWAAAAAALVSLVYVLPSQSPSYMQLGCVVVAVASAVGLGARPRHVTSTASST